MDKGFEKFFGKQFDIKDEGMKQIEGQILLSIVQYFPADCVRMAKKNQGMMNLIIENITEKVRKGIMDYDLESPSLEISNTHQPLFTLTPEEVEVVKNTLEGLRTLALAINPNLDLSNDKVAEDLLTRIKQWQDEIQK